MANPEILATARPRAGKGAARAVRREGKVPAVIYGDKKEPETIAVDGNEMKKLYFAGGFMATMFDIKLEGKTSRVLARDVQLDPVKDYIVHIDFLRIARGATVQVEVQVDFINEEDSPGLKRGGALNIVRHEVELDCPADAIPDSLVADLTGLDIGDTVHMSAIKLPENVSPTITDRDFTIATITGQMAEPAEEEETAAEEEGTAEAGDAAAEDGDEKSDD